MNDINQDPPEGVDENTAQEHGSLSNRMAQALGLRPGEDGKRSINLPDYREAKRQRAVATGERQSQQMEMEKTGTLLGMAQQRKAAADQARKAATDALVGGIADIGMGAAMGGAGKDGLNLF